MRRSLLPCLFVLVIGLGGALRAHQGLIDPFPIGESGLKLERPARPGTPFDKVGRKCAVLGDESGSFEAWAYPLKLFRNFEFSFLVGNSTRPVRGADIVGWIEVTPAVTTLTFTYQSFSVKAHYITPIDEAGSIVLLEIEATEPLTVICSFLPVLQPMWPAGIGGQYAYWSEDLRAYVISEPTRMNHAVVGSPAAAAVSYTPAHMLSDAPSEFKIVIDDPGKVSGRFIPIVLAGGKGEREHVIDVYHKLESDPCSCYRRTVDHYNGLMERTLRIKTPEPRIDLAFEWAKVAYDNLLVDHPDFGMGLVAGLGASGTSGRPGFGWFFGGDAYINSFSMNSYGDYASVREALAFTTQFQREDGKMAHEISQAAGYIDWFGRYPYGYIHGDTSPFFITAVYDYYRCTGDDDFVKRCWSNVKRAYEWCLSTDANGDGLMDNRKAGLGALEYGKLAGGIETDIYIAAIWVRAAQAMEFLAEAAGERSCAREAERHYLRARKSFEERFWSEDLQFYAYAFNAGGEHVEVFSPWSAVGLMWELGDPGHSRKTLQRLCSSELSTDWGVRSISNRCEYYQPLNYNYGAVWPFLNSWVATAQFKHHFPLQGYNTLMATVRHTYDNQLGAINEVFSGSLHTWPQESVSHQGFSTAGVVLPLVRGLFGLEGDAIVKRVRFAPHFPADWLEVSVDNYRFGDAVLSFEYIRGKDTLFIGISARGAGGYTLDLAPALGASTSIRSARIDGREVQFELSKSLQVVQPRVTVPLKDGLTSVGFGFRPAVEVLPPCIETKPGDVNKGLKIISMQKVAKELVLELEGLAGETYRLPVVGSEMIRCVDGGKLKGDRVEIEFPAGTRGEFVRKRIRITGG